MGHSRRLALVWLAALSGCGFTRTDPDPDPDPGPVLIDYEIVNGLVAHRSNLHIEVDGTMTRRLPDGVIQTATLAPTDRDDLQHKIALADFPTLAASYGCGGCVDESVFTLSVPDEHGVRTVSAEASKSPPRLFDLIDTLFQIERAPRDWH